VTLRWIRLLVVARSHRRHRRVPGNFEDRFDIQVSSHATDDSGMPRFVRTLVLIAAAIVGSTTFSVASAAAGSNWA
jgi:hypothetical protein